jgi:anaphase-promoting complex subunit 5
MYCNSNDASYDLAEDEDFDSEMSNLMDADIGSQAGIFENYRQGYASESHMGESSSGLTLAPGLLHDFDEGISDL